MRNQGQAAAAASAPSLWIVQPREVAETAQKGAGVDRDAIRRKAEMFFEDLWQGGDPWGFDTSAFEQRRYDALLAALQGTRYRKVLEIGCGAGAFTAQLLPLAERVLAVDISPTAIAKARARLGAARQVEFRVANVMDSDFTADGPFDLIVMAETIYYLGWLYSFFDLGWFASSLYGITAPNGRLLLANTVGTFGDYLLLPWLIRTYHDLFGNIGYAVERETTFRGEKDTMPVEVLLTLFGRSGQAAER